MSMKQFTTLPIMVAAIVAVIAGLTIALVQSAPSASAAIDDPVVIPGYHYNDPGMTTNLSDDVRTVRALRWKLRYAQDIYGNPVTVSDMDVRLFRSIVEDSSLHIEVRRWALAGASNLVVESPHITAENANWLIDALIDVRNNDPCDRAVHIADLVLTEEIGI